MKAVDVASWSPRWSPAVEYSAVEENLMSTKCSEGWRCCFLVDEFQPLNVQQLKKTWCQRSVLKAEYLASWSRLDNVWPQYIMCFVAQAQIAGAPIFERWSANGRSSTFNSSRLILGSHFSSIRECISALPNTDKVWCNFFFILQYAIYVPLPILQSHLRFQVKNYTN